jgi:hypothetical protein
MVDIGVAASEKVENSNPMTREWQAAILLYLFLAMAPMPTLAQELASSPRTTLELGAIRLSPHARVRPGRILTVRAQVHNPTSSVQRGRLVCKLAEAPADETAYNLELESAETKMIDLPLWVPEKLPAGVVQIQLTLHEVLSGREAIFQRRGQPMLETLRVPVSDEAFSVAIALDREPPPAMHWRWPASDMHESYEMVVGAKVDVGSSRGALLVSGGALADDMLWDAIDGLVICDDRYLRDAAVLTSMKEWLLEGGRLWVMGHQVDLSLITTLLEPHQSIVTLDNVEVMGGLVDVVSHNTYSESDRTIASKDGLSLKRIDVAGAEVVAKLGDWPLATWFSVGRGEILVTTLSPRGMTAKREKAAPSSPQFDSSYMLSIWASDLGGRFFRARQGSPLSKPEFEYPLKQIGNPVVGRRIVLISLAAFLVVFSSMALLLWKMGWASRLSWMAPLVSAVGCVPLLVASLWVRGDVTESVGRLQLIDIGPDGCHSVVHEQSAVFLNDVHSLALTSESETIVAPVSVSTDVGLRRWTWDGFQHWNWSNPQWPAGLTRMRTRSVVPTDSLLVQGSWDGEEVKFELPASFTNRLEDPILQFAAGTPSLCRRDGAGTWRTDESLAVDGDQWMAGNLISDEQVRRLAVYRQTFEHLAKARTNHWPALWGFTELWPNGTRWNRELEQRGSALIRLPIRLSPPPIEQRIRVPAALIVPRLQNLGMGQSTAFDETTGLWSRSSSSATQTQVRYCVPRELLPFRCDGATIRFLVLAPKRRVRMSCLTGNEPIVLTDVVGPSLAMQWELNDPAILASMRDGCLDLQVDIGPVEGGPSAGFGQVIDWSIEYLRVSMEGARVVAQASPL